MVERWNDARIDPETGIVTYETHQLLPDGKRHPAQSQIAFPTFADLVAEIATAGVRVNRWAGDAAGGPIRQGCPDFIPIGGLTDQP